MAVVARYALKFQLCDKVLFAVPTELQERAFKFLVDEDKTKLHFFQINNEDEFKKIRYVKNRWVKHLLGWRLGCRIAYQQNADVLFFAVMDDVLLGSAFDPVRYSGFTISGLIFRASMHYQEMRNGFVSSAREFIKSVTVYRTLKRRDFVKLFTLDPYFAEFARNNIVNGYKVEFLPEPYDLPDVHFDSNSEREQGKIRFLFYGSMQRRKGIEPLLDALKLLPSSVKEKSEFRFCGEGPMVPFIQNRKKELLAEGINITVEARYLSQCELDEEIKKADVILAPYLNHIGSSGVLVTAAAYHKPILSQNAMMIGRELQRYRLGEAVDTHDPAAIAAAIIRLCEGGIDKIRRTADFEGYLQRHGEEKFAQKILNLIQENNT
ncbi:glycosyltransferase [Rhodothermus profundi]|nr:glycosyltransferase [Rhodothermus profundi]